MGLSAPFHENDYVLNRDPFAKHSIPSLFSCRMERASRVTLHLGARVMMPRCDFRGCISRVVSSNERLATRVGRKYGERGGRIEMRSVRAVYLMHDTRLLFVSLLPIFNSSYLPSNKELMSVRPRPPACPSEDAHVFIKGRIAVKWRCNERLNGGARAVTTCP